MSPIETGRMYAAETGQMSAAEPGQMSPDKTGQMSAIETGRMSSDGTRQMPSDARTDICVISTHNVDVSESSIVAIVKKLILKDNLRGAAVAGQKASVGKLKFRAPPSTPKTTQLNYSPCCPIIGVEPPIEL